MNEYIVPVLELILTDLIVKDGVITRGHVVNGCWNIHPGSGVHDVFPTDPRIYRLPAEAGDGYMRQFEWFYGLTEAEKSKLLVDNATLTGEPRDMAKVGEWGEEAELENDTARKNAYAIAQHGKPPPKDYYVYYIHEGEGSGDTAGALYDRTLSTERDAQRRVDELTGKTKDLFSSTCTVMRVAFWTNKRLHGAFV